MITSKIYQTLSKSLVLLNGIRSFLSVVECEPEIEEIFEHEYQNLKIDMMLILILKYIVE